MPENVKFIGKRNSEEKKAEEHSQPVKSLLEKLHLKEPKPRSLEEALECVKRDAESGKLKKLADADTKEFDKLRNKKFKKHEEFSKKAEEFVGEMGEMLLSKEEVSEALKMLRGVRYTFAPDIIGGPMSLLLPHWAEYGVLDGSIHIYRDILPKADKERSIAHEAGHLIEYYLRVKELQRGPQDPVLKEIYDRLKGDYNELVILRVARKYSNNDKIETLVEAIEDEYAKRKGLPERFEVEVKGMDLEFVDALRRLLKNNPTEFRRLLESPSLWYESNFKELRAGIIQRWKNA